MNKIMYFFKQYNKTSQELTKFVRGQSKSSWPSLHETWDKQPLGRDPDRSWCHRHTTNMIKIFGHNPWLHGHMTAAYGQGEKFLAQPTIDVKLRTSGNWIGTQTRAGIPTTLNKTFLVAAHGSMDVSSSTLVCCHRCPWSHGLQPKSFTLVVVTPAPILWVPTQ